MKNEDLASPFSSKLLLVYIFFSSEPFLFLSLLNLSVYLYFYNVNLGNIHILFSNSDQIFYALPVGWF